MAKYSIFATTFEAKLFTMVEGFNIINSQEMAE